MKTDDRPVRRSTASPASEDEVGPVRRSSAFPASEVGRPTCPTKHRECCERRRSRKTEVICWVSLVVGLLLNAGCDDGRPRRVPVSGQVLIDGKPVAAGVVKIVPGGARPAYGQLDAEGRFTLTTFDKEDGCVEGTHRVMVLGRREDKGRYFWLAPKKYWSAKKSGVTATIEGATDSLVIRLTWDGGKPFSERSAGGPTSPEADLTRIIGVGRPPGENRPVKQATPEN